MIACEMCGAEWDEKTILETEGLGHFYAPNEHRKVVEKSGEIWVMKFSDERHISALKQCRKCPPMLGSVSKGEFS